MNLSKTSEYAIRILSFMAIQKREQYTAQELSEGLKIPHRYLRRLLTKLSKAGFILGSKGKGGGFIFARSLADISLADIIDTVEGFEVYQACIFGYENCLLTKKCPMHDAWSGARENLRSILKSTSLADMAVKSQLR
jgi:Rrf2 family transcriptional regulator, iron-sulfur cluster assembly transcription factor